MDNTYSAEYSQLKPEQITEGLKRFAPSQWKHNVLARLLIGSNDNPPPTCAVCGSQVPSGVLFTFREFPGDGVIQGALCSKHFDCVRGAVTASRLALAEEVTTL